MAKLREVEGGRGSWKEVREVEVDSFFVEEICLLVDKICALGACTLIFARDWVFNNSTFGSYRPCGAWTLDILICRYYCPFNFAAKRHNSLLTSAA